MAPSTAELYTPQRDYNGPKCALSGFANKSGNFAEKSCILTGTHRFISALKLKAGMHRAQPHSLPRKGESIIMILYLIDGLYSISFPFCLGLFVSVQLGNHRLVEHWIPDSMNKSSEILEYFSS